MEVKVNIIRGNDEEAKERFLEFCGRLAREIETKKEKEKDEP